MGEATLVLVGPMAAGKSSIGRSTAKLLGLPFFDSDRVIARKHGAVPELFTTLGEAKFREIERETVAELLTDKGVIALGGGAIIDPLTRADLERVPVVYLTVSADVVAGRLKRGNRPLLAGEPEPLERWQTIFDERRGWYEQVADVTFDTSSGPMQHVAERVAEWAREHKA